MLQANAKQVLTLVAGDFKSKPESQRLYENINRSDNFRLEMLEDVRMVSWEGQESIRKLQHSLAVNFLYPLAPGLR